jgi:hypothetical protein
MGAGRGRSHADGTEPEDDAHAAGEQRLRPDQSGSPLLPPGLNGIMTFSCELTHPAWGEGLANGISLPPPERGAGTVQVATRNVLTFPGY